MRRLRLRRENLKRKNEMDIEEDREIMEKRVEREILEIKDLEKVKKSKKSEQKIFKSLETT